MQRRRVSSKPARNLSLFDVRQIQIAKDTLKMPDAIAAVMGGPSKAQARETLKRFGVKEPRISERTGRWMFS